MNEGSTGAGDAGRRHWKPVTPVSAMVVGRLVLGLPSAVGLTIIVLVWSALTRAGRAPTSGRGSGWCSRAGPTMPSGR